MVVSASFNKISVPGVVPTKEDPFKYEVYKTKANHIRRVNRKQVHNRRKLECKFSLAFVVFVGFYYYNWRNLGGGYKVAHVAAPLVGEFSTITEIESWYQWMNGTAITVLFGKHARLSNSTTVGNTTTVWWMLGPQVIVGPVRLRQWRGRIDPDQCHAARKLFPGAPCLPVIDTNEASLDAFGIGKVFNITPSCNTSLGIAEEPFFHTRQEGEFGCASSIIDLPYNSTVEEVTRTLQYLYDHRWLDGLTRGVLLELYSFASLDHMMVHNKFFTEFTARGIVFASTRFDMFPVTVLNTLSDKICAGIHAAGLLYLIIIMGWLCYNQYRTVNIVRELANDKRKLSMVRFWIVDFIGWPFVDMSTYIVILVGAIARLRWFFEANRMRYSKGDYDIRDFPPLVECRLLWREETLWCAGATCLGILRLFKFLNTNPRLNLLTRTLQRAASALLSMAIMFCMSTAAFGTMAHLSFSSYLGDFSSASATIAVLVRAVMGDVEVYEKVREISPHYADFFFLSYIFVAYFVLMNMILAVIVDAFQHEVQEDEGAAELTSQIKKKVIKYGDTIRNRCKLNAFDVTTAFQPDPSALISVTPEDILDKLKSYAQTTFGQHRPNLSLDDCQKLMNLSLPDALHLMVIMDVNNSGVIETKNLNKLRQCNLQNWEFQNDTTEWWDEGGAATERMPGRLRAMSVFNRGRLNSTVTHQVIKSINKRDEIRSKTSITPDTPVSPPLPLPDPQSSHHRPLPLLTVDTSKHLLGNAAANLAVHPSASDGGAVEHQVLLKQLDVQIGHQLTPINRQMQALQQQLAQLAQHLAPDMGNDAKLGNSGGKTVTFTSAPLTPTTGNETDRSSDFAGFERTSPVGNASFAASYNPVLDGINYLSESAVEQPSQSNQTPREEPKIVLAVTHEHSEPPTLCQPQPVFLTPNIDTARTSAASASGNTKEVEQCLLHLTEEISNLRAQNNQLTDSFSNFRSYHERTMEDLHQQMARIHRTHTEEINVVVSLLQQQFLARKEAQQPKVQWSNELHSTTENTL